MERTSNEPGLGVPIAVYSGLGHCHTHGHELVFITDGYHGYAYGSLDASMSRKGPHFLVYCGEWLTLADMKCDGVVGFDIRDNDSWGRGWKVDAEQIALLVKEGEKVDIDD